jgi:hypothetical protein
LDLARYSSTTLLLLTTPYNPVHQTLLIKWLPKVAAAVTELSVWLWGTKQKVTKNRLFDHEARLNGTGSIIFGGIDTKKYIGTLDKYPMIHGRSLLTKLLGM